MKHLVRITNTHRAGKPVVIGTDCLLPTLIFIDPGQTKIVTVLDAPRLADRRRRPEEGWAVTGIVEFLTARLNEDEAAAREEIESLRYGGRRGGKLTAARVLADVESKRQIVELHRPQYVGDDPDKHYGSHYEVIAGREILVRDEEPHPPNWCRTCQEPSPCSTLRLLGLPDADHSDYRQEWRP